MNAFVLARKELASFFNSWMGVMVCVLFYAIAGIFISLLVLSFARVSMDAQYQNIEGLSLTRFVLGSFFLNMSVVLIFLVPAMTMRTLAEERKMQTIELLYTYPFSDFDIVWGKFLGLAWIFEILFLPTIAYLFLLQWLGATFDWGPVLTGYLGFWMLGNAYLTFGLFMSSLTESQTASAVATFSGLIVFWVLDWVADVSGGTLGAIFKVLSPLGHYREFTLGILDLSHIVYFVFFHFFFLFLTLRSVETRNWKG